MAIAKLAVKLERPDEEAALVRGLKALPGVLYAVVSHSAACAEVEFEDDCISVDEIRQAISRHGYDSRLIG